jgi:methylmalonyl-CoA mutase N-terminal domain/subunit
VNRFTAADEHSYSPLRVDPVIELRQAERLAALRHSRDAAEVTRCLDGVKRAAQGSANMLYPLREALRARATVGEVCDALRDIWGMYRPADVY